MLGNAEYSRTYGAPVAQVRGEFFMDTVKDPRASLEAGRDIFRDVESVKIVIPGLIASMVVHRVNDEHRQRWPEAYAAFKAGQETPLVGTPLREWPILNPAAIRELEHMQIRTVEELAVLSDIAVQSIGMGGQLLRERARGWLDDAKHEALTTRLIHENDVQRSEIASLKNQVEELSKQLAVLSDRVREQNEMTSQRLHMLQSYVPGDHDPMELARGARLPPLPGAEPAPASALDRLAGNLAARPVSRRRREIDAGTAPETLGGALPPGDAAGQEAAA